QVIIDATPGVADLRITAIDSAAMNDFSRPPTFSPSKLVDVSLLGLGLISISSQARADMENSKATSLRFSSNDITARATKGVSTHGLTGSLTGSLLGNLHLEAHVLGLKIGVPSAVTTALGTTLQAATTPLDGLLD